MSMAEELSRVAAVAHHHLRSKGAVMHEAVGDLQSQAVDVIAE